MHDERACIKADEDIFRPPVDSAHAATANGALDFRVDRPAQAAVAHAQSRNAFADDGGGNAPRSGFYFR
jgi:hypothetical protein